MTIFFLGFYGTILLCCIAFIWSCVSLREDRKDK